jgi:hypothetical protein
MMIKVKAKLSLCLTNKALRHEDVWGNGCIDPRILDPGRFTPGERAAGTHWIGSWVGLRADLDDVEKRKFLTLPGLELRTLGRLARSQSLYRQQKKAKATRRKLCFSAVVHYESHKKKSRIEPMASAARN